MYDKYLEYLSIIIGNNLKLRHAKITVVESCTGGWITKILTDISGSSDWFEYGFVTYSNKAKQQMVGVQSITLSNYGSVSEQTVKEMVQGACKIAKAEYGIAVSGIAGPYNHKENKPVGNTWFAIAGPLEKIFTYQHIFSGNRNEVRFQCVIFALYILYEKFFVNEI
ncbi:nicotinamide-nucleotide amidase [Pantoea sp. Mhis]|uniref:nicotinamide-nucleotide amidase n=1 Tax=Pantoea sp. Mhis TaxID=2576759 RepID=UPI00135C4F1A|nr:nicotinamide-nucleotide amidase [Pantoea sp. Mhis]MXP56709.1 nicotinamide-nucleotide amidase [Pantoea sp. Mhis]